MPSMTILTCDHRECQTQFRGEAVATVEELRQQAIQRGWVRVTLQRLDGKGGVLELSSLVCPPHGLFFIQPLDVPGKA